MITPEGTEPEKNRPLGGRLALVGVAALIVFAGLIAVGSLTSDQPGVAIPSTTTSTTSTTSTTVAEADPPINAENFDVRQIARGETFEWTSSLEVENASPTSLLEHGGDLYLFAIEAPYGFSGGGLRAWKSADGASWESLGQVITEDHSVSSVVSMGQELVALGPGNRDTTFSIWRSSDAVAWEREDVVLGDHTDMADVIPLDADIAGDLLVVAGRKQLPISRLIEERLGEDLSDSLDYGQYGWARDIMIDEEIVFTLRDVVGLPLKSVTASDLDLSASERRLVTELGETEPQGSIWARTESGWTEEQIPGAGFIQGVSGTDDGRVLVTGIGGSARAWSSTDGKTWESLPLSPRPVDNWGDRHVARPDSGQASVLVSNEAGEWDDIGPEEHFPEGLDWIIRTVAAGPAGVAAMVQGQELPRSVSPREPLPTLTDNGSVLTLDLQSGAYQLETGDTVYTWTRGNDVPEWIRPDLEAGTLSFHDPETEELLAIFDFDSINRAANDYWAKEATTDTVQAFVFTDDTVDWTIQETSGLGERGYVSQLEVTPSHVVAVGLSDNNLFGLRSTSGFVVWSAPIP